MGAQIAVEDAVEGGLGGRQGQGQVVDAVCVRQKGA
ncbi:hypothetical protein SCHAM137S_06540 [Streptomyces chartreusis]